MVPQVLILKATIPSLNIPVIFSREDGTEAAEQGVLVGFWSQMHSSLKVDWATA